MKILKKIIDAHIHLDQYKEEELTAIFQEASLLEAIVSVSFDLQSCKKNLSLSKAHSKVKPAFGFHPEQPLPSESQLQTLVAWIEKNRYDMAAIGEVGLPYYLRKQKKNGSFPLNKYIELLETFIVLAKKWEKPIVLHAVYEDAPIVCDLLEKHSLSKVHFHWFKGDPKTIERMIQNGYIISVTPDVVYEKEIQDLVRAYPMERLMVETDGPWLFEGPFKGIMTSPLMIHQSIETVAALKKASIEDTYLKILVNTKKFYRI
ncbi:TatD family hydrolase [Bacillus gobiensis]